MAYLEVVKLDEALTLMKEKFENLRQGWMTEPVASHESRGRILAQDCVAKENLPSFNRSTVDGYAVKWRDTLGASEVSPMLLHYQGEVAMGERSSQVVEENGAVYVPTGGELPDGADSLIMVEYSERIGPDVALYKTAKERDHVVEIGEDVRQGSCVIPKGTRLLPKHRAVLASLGITEVEAYRPLRLAILSTGDELVDEHEPATDGSIRDCNMPAVRWLAEEAGAEVTLVARVKDTLEDFTVGLKKALAEADMVLLSGGSSAGVKDFTALAVAALDGGEVFVHGLAMKPGKPTIVAQAQGKPIVGLPGHPAACFTVMKLLVCPFLRWLNGEAYRMLEVPCLANFQQRTGQGRETYLLARLTFEAGVYKADIIYGKSGMVSALAQADAMVKIPLDREGVQVGDELTAILLN